MSTSNESIICQLCGYPLPKKKREHWRVVHNVSQDEYEVVVSDSKSLAETRAKNGFTETPGQCYYCSRVFMSFRGLKTHQISCRSKANGAKGALHVHRIPTKRKRRQPSAFHRVVVDGGVISEDDVKSPLPPLPPLTPRPDASNSTAQHLRAVSTELRQLRNDVSLMSKKLSAAEEKRSEITDKYIQLLEQRQNT